MNVQRDQVKKGRLKHSDALRGAGDSLRYLDIFKQAPVAFLVLERNGRIREVNQAALTLLGVEEKEWVDQCLSDWIEPMDRGPLSWHIFEVCRQGCPGPCEVVFIRPDQTRCRLELISSTGPPIYEGSPSCLTILIEIEHRRRREDELLILSREAQYRAEQSAVDLARSGELLLQETHDHEVSEARLSRIEGLFEKVFDTAYLAIAMLDQNLNMLRVNHAFAAISRQPMDFYHGKGYFDLYPDDDARLLFNETLKTGKPQMQFARPFVYHEGDKDIKTWWDWSVSAVTDNKGHIDGLLLCMADVTKRVELERQLMHLTDQERQRMGQELHDGMAQLLTAISIKAKVVEQMVQNRVPEAEVMIRDMSEVIREVTVQIRDLSKLLNPVIVESQGLIPALEILALETQRRMGVSCQFKWADSIPAFKPMVAGHLYRIVQESISNAVRHGQAQSIQIELITDGQKRVLRVVNDGLPLDPAQLERSQGLGVRGMRYRAELIGGSFTIVPRISGGTVVTCELLRPMQLVESV